MLQPTYGGLLPLLLLRLKNPEGEGLLRRLVPARIHRPEDRAVASRAQGLAPDPPREALAVGSGDAVGAERPCPLEQGAAPALLGLLTALALGAPALESPLDREGHLRRLAQPILEGRSLLRAPGHRRLGLAALVHQEGGGAGRGLARYDRLDRVGHGRRWRG